LQRDAAGRTPPPGLNGEEPSCASNIALLRTDRKEAKMAYHIVMDHSGDSRHFFDVNDPEALARAEERFEALIGQGFTAAVRDEAGQGRVMRSFDPTAEETLFYPRLVGG
jgi:hypothetical protein